MEIQAVRIIEFDAGHRVHEHESKCGTLHGHRYKLEAFVRAPELDRIGRVIDFSVIKEKINGWIDFYWDHTTLVYNKDEDTINALMSMPKFKDPFICDFNPTAENMAKYLITKVCPELFQGTEIEVVKIKLWETPNCYVEVYA